MKKILITTLFVSIALIAVIYNYFQKPANDINKKPNILVVGTNPNFPPFEYRENSEVAGFDIDLIYAIGKYLKKQIILKEMPFDSLLIEAQLGRINVIASAMTPTPERSKKVLFTKTYLANDPLVIITLCSQKPQKLEDLLGKEVIVNDGYTAESYMKLQKGINLKRLATPAEAFFDLVNGRSYAYVSARSAVQPFFDRYGNEQFNVLTLSVADSYALAVPKIFPEIFKEVQDALAAFENNGTMTDLKNKWHLNF